VLDSSPTDAASLAAEPAPVQATAVQPVPVQPVPAPARQPARVIPIRRQPAARRRRATAWLGLIGLLTCGVLAVVAAAHTESLLPLSIRPAPPELAGAFAGIGLDLHVGGTIAVLALMFCSYALAVSRSGQLPARVVVAAIVVLHLVVLLGPPLVSTDVFSYQAYARMGAVYGINPYLHGPYAIELDHLFPYIGSKWSYTPSVYGPVFTAASYPLATLAIATSVYAYKSVAALASLALVAVVAACARRRGADPVRAAALVGLNPLLVLYGVGGGHNDLLMLLALAGAVWALLAARPRLGGGLTMLAIGVKLTAGLVLPFAIAAHGARGGRPRRDLLLGAMIVGALIAALSFTVFGSATFHLLGTVRQGQSEGDWKSIAGVVSTRLHLPTLGHVCSYVLAAAFVLCCCWLLRRVWRGQTDWVDGAGWAMLALLIAASSLLPWYVAWLLPFAAVARDRRLWRTAIGMTGVVQAIQLLGYVPHHVL